MGRFFSKRGGNDRAALSIPTSRQFRFIDVARRAAISRLTTPTIHISRAIKPRDKCRSRDSAKRLAPNLHRNRLCSINRAVTSLLPLPPNRPIYWNLCAFGVRAQRWRNTSWKHGSSNSRTVAHSWTIYHSTEQFTVHWKWLVCQE